MHVRTEAELSQVNSNRRRSFEPQEIDISLNTVIGEFVADRWKAYVAGDQQSVDDIATLILDNYSSKLYIPGTDYIGAMPPNLAYLSGITFFGKRICKGQTTPAKVTGTHLLYSLTIPVTVKVSTPWYVAYTLTVDSTPVFTMPAGWAGLTDKDEAFRLKAQLIWAAQKAGLWYQGYGTGSRSGTLFSLKPFSITVDSTTTAATSTTVNDTFYQAQAEQIPGDAISPILAPKLRATPYYGSDKRRPVYYTGANSSVTVLPSQDFILDRAVISGMRKPAIVDVILGIDCDLPDNGKVHEQICRMAVRNLMGSTGDERYPLKKAEEQAQRNNNP